MLIYIHSYIHTSPKPGHMPVVGNKLLGFRRSYGYKLYPTDFFVHVEVTWLLFASISHESVRLQTASLCESWTWHAMVSDRRFGLSSDEFSRTTHVLSLLRMNNKQLLYKELYKDAYY